MRKDSYECQCNACRIPLTECPREKMLHEATRDRNELQISCKFFHECYDRAKAIWQKKHPDADYWPDGAKAIAEVLGLMGENLDRTEKAEEAQEEAR